MAKRYASAPFSQRCEISISGFTRYLKALVLGRTAKRPEALPFRDEVFDGTLATLVLCSVDDRLQVAREVKRTLRARGVLHAIDHVASKVPRVRRLQERNRCSRWPTRAKAVLGLAAR